MGRTPDAASEGADTSTYRRSRSRASRQRSDAGAKQRAASRSAEYLPIPAVSARIFLRISITVDWRRCDWRRLRVKLFSAERPKNSYPADHKKNLGISHDVIPAFASGFRSKKRLCQFLQLLTRLQFGDFRACMCRYWDLGGPTVNIVCLMSDGGDE
jgi:hypothetical protein